MDKINIKNIALHYIFYSILSFVISILISIFSDIKYYREMSYFKECNPDINKYIMEKLSFGLTLMLVFGTMLTIGYILFMLLRKNKGISALFLIPLILGAIAFICVIFSFFDSLGLFVIILIGCPILFAGHLIYIFELLFRKIFFKEDFIPKIERCPKCNKKRKNQSKFCYNCGYEYKTNK